jgi:hypothetical protein
VTYEVGQEVYVEGLNRNPSRIAKVTKVARKWVDITGWQRFDAATGFVDAKGYTSPGRVWLCEADCNAWRDLNASWSALRRAVSETYNMPTGMTHEKIEQIRTLLECAACKFGDTQP